MDAVRAQQIEQDRTLFMVAYLIVGAGLWIGAIAGVIARFS